MNTRTNPDDTLAAWLDTNNVPLPAPTRRAIEVGIRTVHQRRRPIWLPRRIESMSTAVPAPAVRGLAAMVAVAVVVGIGVFAFFGPRFSGVGPPASPSPTASPAPTASSSPVAPGSTALTVLEPGQHSAAFDPPFTFVVPVGWALKANTADEVSISPAAFAASEILVCKDPQPGDSTANRVPGIGTSAREFAEFTASRPDLGPIAAPEAINIGGLDGYWLDLEGLAGGIEVNAVGVSGTPCGRQLYPEQRIRVAFLDAPESTVMIMIWDSVGTAVIDDGTQIVESFEFDLK